MPGAAEHPDVAVGDQQHARAAPRRGGDRRDGFAAADADGGMSREVRRQMRRHGDRSHARPAAAMRNRERLVQVQVTDVGADRRRAREPDLRVHVRAVHVNLAAVLVDDRADLADLFLEHAVRRWDRSPSALPARRDAARPSPAGP